MPYVHFFCFYTNNFFFIRNMFFALSILLFIYFSDPCHCLLCTFNIQIILLALSYFLQAIYFVLLVHRIHVLWVFSYLCSIRMLESCYPFRRAPFASRCADVSNETISSANRSINIGYATPFFSRRLFYVFMAP